MLTEKKQFVIKQENFTNNNDESKETTNKINFAIKKNINNINRSEGIQDTTLM
jgi:hypothetical protein